MKNHPILLTILAIVIVGAATLGALLATDVGQTAGDWMQESRDRK